MTTTLAILAFALGVFNAAWQLTFQSEQRRQRRREQAQRIDLITYASSEEPGPQVGVFMKIINRSEMSIRNAVAWSAYGHSGAGQIIQPGQTVRFEIAYFEPGDLPTGWYRKEWTDHFDVRLRFTDMAGREWLRTLAGDLVDVSVKSQRYRSSIPEWSGRPAKSTDIKAT